MKPTIPRNAATSPTLADDTMKPDFKQLASTAKSPLRNALGAAVAVVTGSALLVLGFMFSLLILSIVATAGLLGYGYLWWKTRALRRQINERMMRQNQHPQPAGNDMKGVIIEGEVVRVSDRLSH